MQSFEEVYTLVCDELANGAKDRNHAYHLMTIATNNEARIVVHRKFDAERRTIILHTDWRSKKVQQIKANPNIEVLFYNPETKIQIRAKAFAHVHYDDELAKARWEATRDHGRKCYAGELAEGTEIEQAGDGLPEVLQHPGRPLTDEEQVRAWENFCVVVCNYSEIDFLQLDSKGHIRATLSWDDAGEMTGKWIVP